VRFAVLLLLAPLLAADDFDRGYAQYKKYIRRPTLRKRTIGRERLAETEDVRALKILAASYPKAEKPRDQVQTLIVSLCADYFAGPEHLPVFREWRANQATARHAYLWYQSLKSELESEGSKPLVAIVKSDRDVFLRAAALEVLRWNEDPALLTLLPEIAGKLPSDAIQRAVMLESCTAALATFRKKKKEPEVLAAAEAVIKRMDEAATLPRTRIVMARYLGIFFGVKYAWRDGKRWLAEIEFIRRGGKQAKDDNYAKRPTFAGIEATGDRICYVIDFSDSMLTPLTPPELKRLPRGPVTGRAAAERKKKEAKSDKWKRAFRAVKWDKVKNRFDAARELLKVSLLGLEENQSFVVIWFGDKADVLKTTRGLRKASAGNIQKTIAELDSFRPGPKADNRPHGTLKGATNLHGGLYRAFRLRGKGIVGPGEYVNPVTFKSGCDTIFVLSDGAPTWDDWSGQDKRDVEDNVGDPESGHRSANQDATTLNFPGPFSRAIWVATDVRRMNLFRKVEIHCVGMGEASMSLLESLAGAGKGEAINLGGTSASKKKKDPPAKK